MLVACHGVLWGQAGGKAGARWAHTAAPSPAMHQSCTGRVVYVWAAPVLVCVTVITDHVVAADGVRHGCHGHASDAHQPTHALGRPTCEEEGGVSMRPGTQPGTRPGTRSAHTQHAHPAHTHTQHTHAHTRAHARWAHDLKSPLYGAQSVSADEQLAAPPFWFGS